MTRWLLSYVAALSAVINLHVWGYAWAGWARYLYELPYLTLWMGAIDATLAVIIFLLMQRATKGAK
jgi:hypothetical protein